MTPSSTPFTIIVCRGNLRYQQLAPAAPWRPNHSPSSMKIVRSNIVLWVPSTYTAAHMKLLRIWCSHSCGFTSLWHVTPC